ncbi:hypothetical protein INT47_012867 [Mucor saturninus]|uniref:F-box domain-containing protein n=1 Tax=Mucor saturninus TaxID=64648 RepID=A0A8H7UV37_9FUNG|nr:hypothetical protein INT47_012867 [Mucor saturninus]
MLRDSATESAASRSESEKNKVTAAQMRISSFTCYTNPVVYLPFETLTEIFLYLVPIRTLEYALVCKSWTKPALCILYQELQLGSRVNNSIRQHLTLGMSERDEYFKYGNLVQKVKLSANWYYPSEEWNEEELITFLEYFPNIKTLDISNSEFCENYYYYLINTKSKKCLNQIQTFEIPQKYLNAFKMHYTLCYKYRATITTMWFKYEEKIDIDAEEFSRTLDYLKQFPNLKDLTVREHDDNATVTIFELQKACPNLTSLDYGIKFDGTKKQVSAFLDDPANRNLQNHLKSLVIRSAIPVEYLKYFNKCDFTQLSVLKMITSGIDLYDWLADMGWDNVKTFLSRLSTLDTVLLQFASTFKDRKYEQMPETKMTTFFKLVDVFKGNKRPFCQMDITDYSTFGINVDSLEYNSVDGLHLSYRLENSEYQKGDWKTPNIDFVLPDVSISRIGLEIVNCLFAIIESDKSRNLQFKFIDHVLTNYPNLELFEFFGRRKSTERITIGRDANHSMTTKKKHHLSATNTKENLRSIEACCFVPPPKLLRMIATHLPNIEFASCMNPTFHFEIEFVSRYMDFGFICFDYGKEGNAIYYHQETSPYSLNACDESFMVECYSKDTVRSSRVNIKCKKSTRIIVSSRDHLMAEFEDGVILDYKQIKTRSKMHILDLPFETLTEIFLYLVPIKTLEYALVCKSWTKPALCIIYQELQLGSRVNSSIRQHLTLGMSERDEYFKYGNLVQKFKLSANWYHPSEELSEEELITFLEYFPNIKTLDISNSEFYVNYYYYLINTKSKKCLNQIQTFEIPQNKYLNAFKMHYALCFKYRATITTMWFEYEDTINTGAEKLDRTLDYLKQFPNLKDLTVREHDDNATVTIFELQKACPNLTSLDYGIKFDGTEKQISAFLDDPANRNLQNHLKSLVIRSSIPVEYLKYLNSCIFTQLSVLKMITCEIDLYDWLADMGWDNVKTFLSRLSTLDTVLLQFASTFNDRKYGKMTETKMTTFFKLVDVFKGNKRPFCQMDITDCWTIMINVDSLEYNSVDGLHLSYGLENCDYQNGDWKTTNINFVLPDVSISRTGLEIVNCLFAIINRDQSRDLQFKFIDHVLTNYPNLELFEFFCRRKSDERITIGRDANHSMTTKQKHHLLLFCSSSKTVENDINAFAKYRIRVLRQSSKRIGEVSFV